MLLATAGVLMVAAAAQRWWPACAWGAFDSGACPARQADAYDFVLPLDPTVALGAATQLHGVALLVLAAAVPLLPAVLTGRPVGWALRLAAVAVSLGVVVTGVVSWHAGRVGEVVSAPGTGLAGALWVLGLPCLALALGAVAEPARRRVDVARWAVVGFLVGSNPVATTLFLAPLLLGYASYDTTPWTEAVSGVFLVAAAICLVPATWRDRPARPRAHVRRAAPAGR